MASTLPESLFENPIKCIDMHTTGEPTRIIYYGYPDLRGSLLEQRSQARREHDHIRRRLILEPRGHYDMYGAILRPITELTESGEADMGVLFLTNDGYSTMCGHATIALGRFLLDLKGDARSIFPQRDQVKYDKKAKTALLRLHAPCGLVKVTVPVKENGESDPARPVSFDSVPSYATGINIDISIPESLRWPQLKDAEKVVANFSYGGAYFCFIDAAELGFEGGLAHPDISQMNFATKQLKAAIIGNPDLHYLFQQDEKELSALYSIVVVDKSLGIAADGTDGAETGLCFFADQQIDRSPTGSAVQARVALALARSQIRRNGKWTYHSLVSNSLGSRAAFTGSVGEIVDLEGMYSMVTVRVEGFASYTGYSTFFVEKSDPLGDDGFVFGKL